VTNLSQQQAQKLLDFYTKEVVESAESPYKLWRETQEKWREEIKADPVIGGKLDHVRATVAKAIDGACDPKLANDCRSAMDFTGAGNNPAIVKAFYQMALKLTEGGAVPAGGPSPAARPGGGQPTSVAAAMYPNLPSSSRSS
jgi:hypothetical protein